jgi:hypothetical protein
MKKARKVWTPEEEKQLKQLYPDSITLGLAILFQCTESQVHRKARALGVAKSAEYLAGPHACSLRRGDGVGKETRFKTGHKPWNTGRKGIRLGGGAVATQFKTGQKPHTWQPIGSERINADGYRQRKMTDTGYPPKDWAMVHILLWEEHHGSVPKGHVIVFKDKNRAHIEIENLECISRVELMRRNTIHRYPPELKDAMRLVGRVNQAIRKRSRHEKQDDRSA